MNETVSIITQLVNSLGFPIAACVYLAYFQNKTIKDLTDVLHNNTTALEKLLTRMEVDDNDHK